MYKVLLTRNHEANLILADNIKSKIGGECFSFPMFFYQEIEIDFNFLDSFTDIIVTSNFAATILIKFIKSYVNVWVVGVKTAETLSRNPYVQIRRVADNIETLEHYLRHYVSKHNFVYCSGSNITKELFGVQKKIIYQTIYRKNIPEELLTLLHEINAIMFFSYFNAKVFINLLVQSQALSMLKSKNIITLSRNIGLLFDLLNCNVYYCKNNKSEEMIEILKCLKI